MHWRPTGTLAGTENRSQAYTGQEKASQGLPIANSQAGADCASDATIYPPPFICRPLTPTPIPSSHNPAGPDQTTNLLTYP